MIHPNFQKYIVIGSIFMLIIVIMVYYMISSNLDIEAVSVIENSDYVTKNE